MRAALRTRALLAIVGLAACSASADDAPTTAGVEPLPSPAGPSSGEPFLTATESGTLLSWLEATGDTAVALRFARFDGTAWSEPQTIATRADFFVNWADFPSIIALPDGRLAAHWLQREGEDTYAYGIRIVQSEDNGATWSDPISPHTDGTLTEHGFVTLFPDAGGLGAVWLDGRAMGGGHGEGGGDMTVRAAHIGAAGELSAEAEIDARTCECCQTDVAITAAGPVLVYRDRSPEEVRNIAISRRIEGVWTAPRPVHDDAWTIEGCPVNGPSVVADGSRLAVAWFAAPDDQPQVKVAFSSDGGVAFGDPVRVDAGAPAGRVDLLALEDGAVLVSWVERTEAGAEVRARRVGADGSMGQPIVVSGTSAERASGFPRMARTPAGVLFAWTEPGEPARVRVARLTLD